MPVALLPRSINHRSVCVYRTRRDNAGNEKTNDTVCRWGMKREGAVRGVKHGVSRLHRHRRYLDLDGVQKITFLGNVKY